LVLELVLIRHGPVRVDLGQPSVSWHLSDDADTVVGQLSGDQSLISIERLYASPELKAVATANLLATGRPVIVVEDLRELNRQAAGWVGGNDDYAAMVADILWNPERSIQGCEPAVEATSRICRAIGNIVDANPTDAIAVVSHGIVLTLYVSWLRGLVLPDVGLWRRLRIPDLAVVDPIQRKVLRDFGARVDA
jgi:broad specificity phosphatase PhoE